MGLALETYENWVSIFSDRNCLKILLYLKDYNPNVRLVEMEKKLNMKRGTLDKKITALIEAGLVKIAAETPTGFSLTDYGRVGTNRLLALAK